MAILSEYCSSRHLRTLARLLPAIKRLTKQVHHDQVLLSVVDKIIHVANVLQAWVKALTRQLLENLVLENEYVFVLVLLLDLQGDVLPELVVKSLVDHA